jgi:hypothetical protein
MTRNILLASACALLLQAPAHASYTSDFDINAGEGLSCGLSIPGQGTSQFNDGLSDGVTWTGLSNGLYQSTGGAGPSVTTASPLGGAPYSWVSTDQNQADAVQSFTGWGTAGSNWAAIGGGISSTPGGPTIAPSTGNVQLWTPLSEQDVDFNVNFGITLSTGATASTGSAQDTFGWTFRTATGSELFAILFEPSTTSGTLNVYTQSSTGALLPTGLSISTGAIYTLNLLTNLGANSFQANLSGDGTSFPINFANIPAGTTSIGAIAATWDLSDLTTDPTTGDLTDYGSNMMLFDDYTVESVPEPSSVVLAIGGLLGIAGLRRRRRAA